MGQARQAQQARQARQARPSLLALESTSEELVPCDYRNEIEYVLVGSPVHFAGLQSRACAGYVAGEAPA